MSSHKYQYQEYAQECERMLNRTPSDCLVATVVQLDALTCAQVLHENQLFGRIGVLNFACAERPGGNFDPANPRSVMNVGQEENLCARSDLYEGLKPKYYPLDAEGNPGLLYLPDVEVLRDARYKAIRPFVVDFFTIAATRMPHVRVQESQDTADYEDDTYRDMYRRVNLLAMSALQEKYGARDVLIAGAWGCGAYCHPPYGVARLFQRVLPCYPFNVVYAVPDPKLCALFDEQLTRR